MWRILTLLALLLVTLGQATETEVVFEGSNAALWDNARDASRLAQEFSKADLSAAKDPDSISWRFVSKGVAFNDIFLRRPVDRPFSALRVRVRNEGAPVSLAMKLADAGGAEWTVKSVPLAAGGDWQWVEFPREEWKVAGWSNDPDGRLDFPLRYVTLIAFDVKPGPEYSLRIARVEAVRPDPPVATLTSWSLAKELQAGGHYPFSATFSLDKPALFDDAFLILRKGKGTVLRLPLTTSVPLTRATAGELLTVRVPDLAISLFCPGGELSALLQLGDARVIQGGRDATEEVCKVTVNARKPGTTVAAVKPYKGVPTLFINGAPHRGMAYAAYGPSVEVFTDFAKAGVDLFTFSATPTEAGYTLSRTTWTAPDEYDYSQLDERVMMVLQANPEAYFFPRLYVHAPKWWSEQHPDDLVLMDPGDGKPVPFIHSGGKLTPSWASETWRKDTIEGLRRLIAHIEASPYADRVIGYHIASGTTEEWMMWGANERSWVDYSPVNIARFRDWLRKHYATVQDLRAAWKDPEVTFETAAIPLRSVRERAELGSLRDPEREQQSIDFYEYNSDLVADTVCTFASAVKDITRGEKTVGVFYGYLLQLCGEQRQQNAGHLALERVLASPDIDFVCSPTSYAFRQLGGEGTSHFMSLLGSVKLHGKLWFDENDIRTSLSGGKTGEWGRPADVAGDLLQQDKELANVITNGAAQWWFDVGSNKYNDPVLMDRIAHLTTAADQALSLDRTSKDEVALVVDEDSLRYLKVGDAMGTHLLLRQLPSLQRIGAPVGHYLTSDLPSLMDRKMLLLTTSIAPSDRDRRNIEAAKSGGRALVFCWAPGLYRNGKLDETGMADLSGIRLKLSHEATPLRITIDGTDPLVAGLQGQSYGIDTAVTPVALPDDPSATVLGTLPDGRPGLVVKRYPTWLAVYSAAPLLPSALLRRIAEAAGVHEYITTEDVVWASQDLVAVCVKDPGRRTISLPRKADVTDLYSGEKLGTAVDRIEADFADRATRVFVLH